MPDELIERREALRALDRRLTALSVDIDNIIDEANEVRVYVGPIGASFDVATSGPEGQVLEELGEIAHELQVLVEDEVVPEIPDASGWSVTARDRITEFHRIRDEMQLLVREAFAETVAQLPRDLASEPLAELTELDQDFVAPGDTRARNHKLLVAASFVAFALFVVITGLVDMDAVDLACATQTPCPGDAPEVAVHPGGWIVVERKNAACEDGVRILFDRDGTFIERVQPGESAGDARWPDEPARAEAPCAQRDSLRWTWIISWRRT